TGAPMSSRPMPPPSPHRKSFGPSGRLPALAGAFPGSARRLTTLRRHLFEYPIPPREASGVSLGTHAPLAPPFPPPQAGEGWGGGQPLIQGRAASRAGRR